MKKICPWTLRAMFKDVSIEKTQGLVIRLSDYRCEELNVNQSPSVEG